MEGQWEERIILYGDGFSENVSFKTLKINISILTASRNHYILQYVVIFILIFNPYNKFMKMVRKISLFFFIVCEFGSLLEVNFCILPVEAIRKGKRNNRTSKRQLFRQNSCLRQGRAKTQRKQQKKRFKLGKFQMIHDGNVL